MANHCVFDAKQGKKTVFRKLSLMLCPSRFCYKLCVHKKKLLVFFGFCFQRKALILKHLCKNCKTAILVNCSTLFSIEMEVIVLHSSNEIPWWFFFILTCLLVNLFFGLVQNKGQSFPFAFPTYCLMFW